MKLIKHEGQCYWEMSWQKPEDTDYFLGECCYGIYPMTCYTAPVLVMANGDRTFRPVHHDFGNIQPLYVLGIPAINETTFVRCPDYYNQVGDARDETH